jgi:hypothetical protein
MYTLIFKFAAHIIVSSFLRVYLINYFSISIKLFYPAYKDGLQSKKHKKKVVVVLLVFFFFFLFCSTGAWTQSLMPVRQVLYHLSHSATSDKDLIIFTFSSISVFGFCTFLQISCSSERAGCLLHSPHSVCNTGQCK